MAIRRQKLDRKANLTLNPTGRIVDMPPGWAFTVNCPHHGKIYLDFNPYRMNGRDDLAGHMRDAFWSLRHEVVGATLKSYDNSGLRRFWNFLNELHIAGELVTRLDQIDRYLLDRYLAWLELQVVKSNSKNKGQPLSINAKRSNFKQIKALLTNRQKRASAAVSPELSFPRNPFPNSNQLAQKRRSYSPAEQERIVEALNKDLRHIHEGEGEPLSPLQVLAVHLLLLALVTGRNLQPLLELRRDSLREHPLEDRELLITTKRRGWSTHATSIRKVAVASANTITLNSIPASIGDHIRFLCNFTAPLVEDVADDVREFVFLWRVTNLKRKGKVVQLNAYNANDAVNAIAKRHALYDDYNQPLALNVARMRPTFATELYRRTRDIRSVQQALGHAKAETTARYYADTPLEAERDHSIVLDGMVNQFSRTMVDGKVLLAADGKIPLLNVINLLSGGYNTGIARCRNPFRENDSVCKKFFSCFSCPSMIVFEDDLWRLFSFYYRLLSERVKINPGHWMKTYGPIIRRIDAEIATQFPADKVEAAKLKAQQDPHPTWKGPLL
jgi:integrase